MEVWLKAKNTKILMDKHIVLAMDSDRQSLEQESCLASIDHTESHWQMRSSRSDS